MKQICKALCLSLAAMTATASAQAANLWVIGSATTYGWNTDDATAIVSTLDQPNVYTGTLYLTANQELKFMTVPEWGNLEYGAVSGGSLTNGKVALASGTNDEGYDKIFVAEDANYLITVDTEAMQATIVKSTYQDAQVLLSSLFMVGDATPGGWSVDNGTAMHQDPEAPYCYTASNVYLEKGEFKIATVIKGGGSWDGKYWYFRDANDANKIALNQDGDLKWQITENGKYDVAVNTDALSIAISPANENSIVDIAAEQNNAAEYFTLTGIRVENPQQGLYIRRTTKGAEKVFIK